MNNITEITKRDIFELFKNGYTETDIFSDKKNQIKYLYYGRLNEMEFLNKLYPLDEMPSNDSRFENARYDIIQHTVSNDDWEFGWIFSDDRFELLHGSDTKILDFLCTVFHPENRKENGHWKSFLEQTNFLIRQDGYELYEENKMSGRSVYNYRQLSPEEIASQKFIPFSIRYKNVADNTLSIPKNIRKEIYNLFERHNETQYRTDETNWHYEISSLDALINDIKEYYTPKAFIAHRIYSKTNDLEIFVMNNFPYCVFDAIELFAQYNCDTFPDEVNLIFQNHEFSFRLLGGKIERIKPIVNTKEIIKEAGLRELIEQATSLYRSSNIRDKQIAVEKLWDAFERLKTYYGVGTQKKASVEKIIAEISSDDSNYISLFNDEFEKLSKIGNDYRIRHHEMNKIDITDNNHYDYFFQRCFALIDLALKYLKTK
jgi:hypothetical protein